MISLLPDDYMARRSQRRANIVAMTLFAIVMMSVIAAAVLMEQSSRHTVEVGEHIRDSYGDAAKLVSTFQRLETTRDTMLTKATLGASLLDRVPRSYILAIVTNAMPERASLTRLELSAQQVAKKQRVGKAHARRPQSEKDPASASTEPPVTLVTVEMTGLGATDVEVAKFMNNLARNPMTASVDLIYSQERRMQQLAVREFKVRLELTPDWRAPGESGQTRQKAVGASRAAPQPRPAVE